MGNTSWNRLRTMQQRGKKATLKLNRAVNTVRYTTVSDRIITIQKHFAIGNIQ